MIKLFFFYFLISCQNPVNEPTVLPTQSIQVGAEQFEAYQPLIQNKKVALVANQSSLVGEQHLLDFLLEKGIDIGNVMTPEHGFRGEADAGETIQSNKDIKTGIDIISIYGKNKKPKSSDLEGIEVVIFDLQDVGVRFYTYISTLHYVMEACAEQGIPVIILDRPNPNAHFVDGPMLDPAYKSFLGMHPVPVVYGMTIGEYGQMINGEAWLENKVKVELTVIPCQHYTHQSFYELPVKPSPNLPNIRSILLYPSLCFFEGTHVSIGRGTDQQFQVIGSPLLKAEKSYDFKPVSKPGAKYPKHENVVCYGDNLSSINAQDFHSRFDQLDLSYLIEYYQYFVAKEAAFFLENKFIDKLAGSDQLRLQITKGMSEDEIRAHWQADLADFKTIRAKYLIYGE